METQRIPLFPLDVVLLPGRLLPLHIFEPRYKLMIRECREAGAEFGVVLVRQEHMASVGCTAEIVQVLQTYDDGSMDIATLGRSACRIHDLHDEKPYLEGTIEILADDVRPGPAETAAELRALFDRCYRLLHSASPPAPEEDPGVPLSYRISGALPLDLEVLQELLELRVETERLALLAIRLKELLARWERLSRMRSKAAGNGHGPV